MSSKKWSSDLAFKICENGRSWNSAHDFEPFAIDLAAYTEGSIFLSEGHDQRELSVFLLELYVIVKSIVIWHFYQPLYSTEESAPQTGATITIARDRDGFKIFLGGTCISWSSYDLFLKDFNRFETDLRDELMRAFPKAAKSERFKLFFS